MLTWQYPGFWNLFHLLAGFYNFGKFSHSSERNSIALVLRCTGVEILSPRICLKKAELGPGLAGTLSCSSQGQVLPKNDGEQGRFPARGGLWEEPCGQVGPAPW